MIRLKDWLKSEGFLTNLFVLIVFVCTFIIFIFENYLPNTFVYYVFIINFVLL